MTDSPYVTQRNDELRKIQTIIEAEPGLSQNAIWKKSGMMKSRFVKLLQEGVGTLWKTKSGEKNSICYFPVVLELTTLPLLPSAVAPGLVNSSGRPAFKNRRIGEKIVIGKGHPATKENAQALRKSGAVLFFATDSNLLFASEEHGWVNLGQVVPLDGGPMNQPVHPKLEGFPYSKGARLQGVGE